MYYSVPPRNELRHFTDHDIIFAVDLYMHCDKGTAHGDPASSYGKEDNKSVYLQTFQNTPSIILVTL